ncbi:MAG TPA: nucleotide disphospho-sugar-binding domain-containing protein [Acidimicrobiales bacterium]|nr:nucleotide disphospho-sugar-binding domain-containing protein [Acidimicrobiales bacterium]
MRGERSGLPTVALVHTLYTALLVDGAPHPIGMAGSIDAVNSVRAELGLVEVARHADLLRAAALGLVAAPRELDAAGPVPPDVVYAGGLSEGPGPDAGWTPPPGPGPLVVVSLGTAGSADPEREVLIRVTDALGRLPVRGLVNLPGYIDGADLTPAANVVVSDYVRHAAVLPHAALLVTHAGLGSVVAALDHAVPMVCLPLGRDQPENARAVARVGAGSVLSPDASAEEITTAVKELLARRDRIRLAGDPDVALERLERVLAGSA